jgi:ParB family chromosome partitioning protein
MLIDVGKVIPNPEQPRTVFDADELQVLADSMQTHGLLNPIAVEGPIDGDLFVLLDGERRWRAAKLAGWTQIEAHVRPPDEQNGHHRLTLALVGNLQRSDMGPVDMAQGYKALTKLMTVTEVAAAVGKSESHVYTYLKLLEFGLHPTVMERLNRRELPYEYTMLKRLAELPQDDQVRLALRAIRIKASATAIKAMIGHYMRAKPMFRRLTERHALTNIPALDVSGVTMGETLQPVETAMRAVCQECGMDSEDNLTIICRDCPLVLLAKKLAEECGGGNVHRVDIKPHKEKEPCQRP